MSVYRLSAVWQHSKQTFGPLLVMLALADFADDTGFCYPSVGTIALKSRLSKRQVQRILPRLIRSGELLIERKGGFHKGQNWANQYRVTLGGVCEPIVNKRGDKLSWGDIYGKKRGLNVTLSVIEPYKGARARPASFGGVKHTGFSASRQDLLETAKRELHDILHPGGCAYRVVPTDPKKLKRCEELASAIASLRTHKARRGA